MKKCLTIEVMCFEQTARERFLILQCTVQQYVVHVVVVLGICYVSIGYTYCTWSDCQS